MSTPSPARWCRPNRKPPPRKRPRRSRKRRNRGRRSISEVQTLRLAAPLLLLTLCAAAAAQEQPPPLTLAAATDAALRQVSALQQAQIDEQIAIEDVRQARAALLPRARDAFSITYNSPERGNPPVPSFIAANAVHEYQNLLGVTGEWNFGLLAAVRRSRALLDAARAGTEVARRALRRGVAEAYYGAALATAKRAAAEQSLAAAEEFPRATRPHHHP